MTIRSRVLPFVLLGLLSVPQPASPQEPATLLILPSLVLDGLQLAVSDAQLAIDSHRPLTLQASAYCATDTASELVVLLSAPRSPKGDVRLGSTSCTADTTRLTKVLNLDERISHIVRAKASVRGSEIVLAPTWVLGEDGRVTKLPPRTPPLARIPLTGLNISTGDAGIGPVSLTVTFQHYGTLVGTALTEESVHTPQGIALEGHAAGRANGLARIPISLLNRLLADTRPRASLGSDMGTIDLVDLRFREVAANRGGSLSGRATVSGTTFPFLLTFSGDNFSLRKIVISPPDNRCGPEPHDNRAWMSWALCTAKHDLAEKVAATLSTALTRRYRGEFLIPVFPSDPLVVRKERTALRLVISQLQLRPLEEALFAAVQAIPIAK